ncbi:M23 family metallopeptidase [Microlunatus sp. Gsoil 973]|uniref:M23 family metallopeptidase n=1 Tax=Microlunatus sp. Gsoil 973 TaxID=2672569 RepID=UPI0012B49E4F|nr:M23 family metallopeptidase [Microlunatus sp. Gsoil 973]QGN33312.1 peptidoglycan DD-metalloendopeptidase family protein [Microlunatus sp. Gsoil 973]
MRTAVGLAALAVIGNIGLVTTASADGLHDRHKALQQAISKTKQDMSESSATAAAAAVALTKAEQQLKDAQAELAKTQQEVAAAQKKDDALAAKLKQQQEALAKAKAAVVAGQKRLDKQKAVVGAIVRDDVQKHANLLPLAMLTTSTSMGDLANRIQLSQTMLDTNQAKFETYTALQKQLEAEKAKQAALEKQIAADKAEAAKNLEHKKVLEQQAEAQKATVAELVKQRAAAQAAADQAAAQDKARFAELQKEDAAVQKRIAARIAAQKAAARRAAARRAAAEAAARARHHSHSHSHSGGGGGGSSSSYSAHHGFIYPVDGPITSPYGMRLHPILHVWKLHDGTDFGVGCGTPIRAPYPGRVTEEYYNAGYGNRLFIDHGRVDGHYITTAMNHAIRYIVSPGQHVSQGQVVGYVGETGYATGCHLHLMVWEDGNMINPMRWY